MENAELTDPIKSALKTLFGLDYLFPYQRLVISNILEAAQARGFEVNWPVESAANAGTNAGAEVRQAGDINDSGETSDRADLGRQIVILPTGAGKSLCFQLPAMLLSGPTLVIYPILSLMADQERRLREKGFAPALLRGGQSPEEREAVWESLRSGKSRFIIANPEVLLTRQVMEKLPSLGIVHLVVDEAHCVSEWGESFRPSYLQINEIFETICGNSRGSESGCSGPLMTAFTATASETVLEKIDKYIFGSDKYPLSRRIIGNPDRSNIVYSARGALLRDLAVRDLLAVNERPAIVFCSSRNGVMKLARYLQNSLDDREIKFYHAGLSREEKSAVEKWFFTNPDGVLVSTCAYGMGVDKADIRTIIHRDCPPSVEAYLQESGRAGRDGKQSRAIMLWGPEDDKRISRITNSADRKRMEALVNYGRGIDKCRRDELLNLLNYEGPRDSPGPDCCDVCQGRASGIYREEKSMTDFFKRNKRVYTITQAAAFLTMDKNLRWSGKEAGEVITCLIKMGKLKKLRNLLWKEKLTVSGVKNQ
ncbi:MAG: RecQ family ATP-dependent DNA helicase [Treponema sp.]|nr:RecQ family ATP-dependent DNA helicase [Treponema sp.]